MRWLLLMLGVAALLWTRRQWQRAQSINYRVNDDSARRRLAALMPPIERPR